MRLDAIKDNVIDWLRQGVSPRRLALTLALGFAVGCIPVVGIPTVLCAALAFGLRLNLPAIQAANYFAMPFQLALIVPFVRLGGRLFSSGTQAGLKPEALLHVSSLGLGVLTDLGALAGHALVAWLIVAGPAVLLMTATFTLMLQRIPALATDKSGR
jgi:uncharacterized protein (DUF2062 family)